MIDFLRNMRKSEGEKRQEALSAYLDDALTPAERDRFEELLAADETLRASLQEQRLIRTSLGRLPRMRAPRNFTLDPALYGRPVPSTSERLYPIMRTATAVVAILFVVVLVLDFGPFGGESQRPEAGPNFIAEQPEDTGELEPAIAQPAAEAPAEAERIDEAVVEVTQEVEAPAVEELVAAAPAAEEAAVEEEAVEEAESSAAEDASGGGISDDTPPAEEAPLAPEADEAGDPATGELPRPLATISAAKTAETAAEIAQTEEALAGQPVPSQTASALAAADDDADVADDGATELRTVAEARTTPSTTQILAIVLGGFLILLAAATLLLRLRTR